MNKKIIIVLCISVCMVMGSALVSQKVAMAAYDAYECWIPYNIKSGSWNTGIHIAANCFSTEYFKIKFFYSTGCYRTVYLRLADSPGGWTGTIQDLFNLTKTDYLGEDLTTDEEDPEITALPGTTFASPSFIIIYSYMSYFMVSQFIINSVMGYGYQTFYSWPCSMEWPYVDTTTLSEPLSQSFRGEGDCASRD